MRWNCAALAILACACAGAERVDGTAPALDAMQQSSSRRSPDGVWETIAASTIGGTPTVKLYANSAHAIVRLNKEALDQVFARAPHEDSGAATQPVLTLPFPDGQFAGFRIAETSVLNPALAAAYPQFKTLRGVSDDDPSATARIDWTADGFHALVLATDSVVVEPYIRGNLDLYITYFKSGAVKEPRPNR